MPATIATVTTITMVATIKTATVISRPFSTYEHSPRELLALTLPLCACR